MRKIVLIVFLFSCWECYGQKVNKEETLVIPLTSKNDSILKNTSPYTSTFIKGRIAFKELKRINTLPKHGFISLRKGLYSLKFPRHSLALRVEQNATTKIYEGNTWMWGTLLKETILVSGKSDVEIIDALITPQSAKNYRYRIIQNDNKELVGWTTPSVFKSTNDGLATYCHLGKIKYQKNQLIFVEIYNINSYKDRDAVIINWREPKPLEFWKRIYFRTKTGKEEFRGLGPISTKQSAIETKSLNNVKFRLADSLLRLKFMSQPILNPYNYQIGLKRIVNEKQEYIDLGEFNGTYFLYKEFWDRPGKYEITFTPKLKDFSSNHITYLNDQSVSYTFTVLPELNPKFAFSVKELFLGIILLVVIVLSIFYFIKLKAKRRLENEKSQKRLSQIQLGSIRSQLNPHFLFNALAGIQKLMNTDKIDEANRYLGKFARLTRNVLDHHDLISLREEKDLLEDYLQMEQLRFGFIYQIDTTPDLNLENIEIPSMLLQPFVENAVKHGISDIGAKGKIEVSFSREAQNLILKVKDNGKGFDHRKEYSGLGLQLSKNRISLLNTIYKETPFLLDMQSSIHGSEITITLTQWL